MHINILFGTNVVFAIASLFCLFNPSYSYSIDARSCGPIDGPNSVNIVNGVNEALGIVDYAAFRARTQFPPMGDVLPAMMGSTTTADRYAGTHHLPMFCCYCNVFDASSGFMEA